MRKTDLRKVGKDWARRSGAGVSPAQSRGYSPKEMRVISEAVSRSREVCCWA
jgi:hypothetical protein